MCDYLFQYIILNDNFLTELYVYTQTDLILSSWPITEWQAGGILELLAR